MTPERRAALILKGRLLKLAKEIAAEADAKTVRIVAEFNYYRAGRVGSLRIRVFTDGGAGNERGSGNLVQPSGTKLLADVGEVVKRKFKDIGGDAHGRR